MDKYLKEQLKQSKKAAVKILGENQLLQSEIKKIRNKAVVHNMLTVLDDEKVIFQKEFDNLSKSKWSTEALKEAHTKLNKLHDL